MITLELTSEDANLLYAILKTVLSDLRVEMAGTENPDVGENVK